MTSALDFATVDVFTSQRYAGNPLAIVQLPAGQDLDTDRMQLVAREFNFSETVFVYEQETRTDTPTWGFRIFTTKQELTFAGHPTIGTASYLFSKLGALGKHDIRSFSLLCQAGPIECALSDGDDSLQDLPGTGQIVSAKVPHDFHVHSTAISREDVLKLQPSLQQHELGRTDLVSPVRGMTFLVVELPSSQALQSVGVTGTAPRFALDKGWDFGFLGTAFYYRTGEGHHDDRSSFQYSTRMIETQMEDPATGSMSCGLAALLALRADTAESDFLFTQGTAMGRESHIGVHIILDDARQEIKTIAMRGQAVDVTTGLIRV